MAYVRMWIYVVWATKCRYPYFTGPVKYDVFNHMRYNAGKKGIYISEINGYLEHVHCLISLTADQSVAGVVQLLKGESSYWINRQEIIPEVFEWADEYYAASVSESQVEKVRQYIRNQEAHHRWKGWDEELDEFLRKHHGRLPGASA